MFCPSVSCHSANETTIDSIHSLFDYLDTPGVFACDGTHCVWTHQSIFTQEMECSAGICMTDYTIPVK